MKGPTPVKLSRQSLVMFAATLALALSAVVAPFVEQAHAAITYAAATKNARLTAVRDAIDGGPAAGTLQICTNTSCSSVLATITLNDPSGTVSGGVLTFSGFPKSDTSADGTGTAGGGRIRDSTGTEIYNFTLTATGGGGDLTLDNTSIVTGQTVTINSLTLTHP